MAIKDRVRHWLELDKAEDGEDVDAQGMSQQLLDFLGISRKDTKDALSETTYYACIKILSETMGKMPLKVMRKTDSGGVRTMERHPLYKVLHDRPNPYMTPAQFWSKVEFDRNHYGNAYVWIRGAGAHMQLWILPPTQVEVWYDDARLLADQPDVFYLYYASGKTYKLSSEEVLHFKGSQTRADGLVGISVREQLATTIGGSIQSQRMLNKMYESGFTAKAVLNYTGSLNEQNVQTLVSGIEEYATGGLKESGVENIIPIPLGFNLQPLNVKLADNEYVSVRQYTSTQIAAAFGIKPYQVNDLTKSSYASVEAQQLSFYVDTLLYILQGYEQEIGWKLLTQEELDDGLCVKFNVNVILRTDPEKQMRIETGYMSAGVKSSNEVRYDIDLPARDGCDELLCNGSNIPVRMAGQQYVQREQADDAEQEPTEEEQEETPEEGKDE